MVRGPGVGRPLCNSATTSTHFAPGRDRIRADVGCDDTPENPTLRVVCDGRLGCERQWAVWALVERRSSPDRGRARSIGQAILITTGGLVPAGAVAFVRKESGQVSDCSEGVRCLTPKPDAMLGEATPGRHIRPAGEESAAGELLITPTQSSTPTHCPRRGSRPRRVVGPAQAAGRRRTHRLGSRHQRRTGARTGPRHFRLATGNRHRPTGRNAWQSAPDRRFIG